MKVLCVTKLSVTKWWVTKLHERDVWDKVVCDSVCKVVRDKVAGERVVCWRVGGRAGGWTGVRNKKHEPHTKMWGTITIQSKSRHFTFPA